MVAARSMIMAFIALSSSFQMDLLAGRYNRRCAHIIYALVRWNSSCRFLVGTAVRLFGFHGMGEGERPASSISADDMRPAPGDCAEAASSVDIVNKYRPPPGVALPVWVIWRGRSNMACAAVAFESGRAGAGARGSIRSTTFSARRLTGGQCRYRQRCRLRRSASPGNPPSAGHARR